MQAKNPELLSVRSHTVSIGYNFGFGVEKEECYPEVSAEWRGQKITLTMSADRYLASNGWSEWRIFVYHTPLYQSDGSYTPNLSDTARSRIRDAVKPLIEEWLASPEYVESRKRAFAWMIRNEIREERYSTDRPREILGRYKHELTTADATRFRWALDSLQRFLELLNPKD